MHDGRIRLDGQRDLLRTRAPRAVPSTNTCAPEGSDSTVIEPLAAAALARAFSQNAAPIAAARQTVTPPTSHIDLLVGGRSVALADSDGKMFSAASSDV